MIRKATFDDIEFKTFRQYRSTKNWGVQIIATASMKVGNTIEHSEHLFLEKVL